MRAMLVLLVLCGCLGTATDEGEDGGSPDRGDVEVQPDDAAPDVADEGEPDAPDATANDGPGDAPEPDDASPVEDDATRDADAPEVLPCYGDDDCDDGRWCNGLETCEAYGCSPAPEVLTWCRDDDACTNDGCDEDADRCTHTLRDDDGDGHAMFRTGCTVGPPNDDCNDWVPTTYTGAPEDCSDGIDNDCDTLTDWVGGTDCDPDCPARVEAYPDPVCFDGWDNDCDGLPDCRDPGCQGGVELCDNGRDDDCDGCADCGDSDCPGHATCTENTYYGRPCVNGYDEDCDTLVDCADPDCLGDPYCA